MSEYIEIESELSDDGRSVAFYTNLPLTQGEVEQYDSLEEMVEGSPLAQALSVVDGIVSLRLEGDEMELTPDEELGVQMVINDVTAVLKDFFL